jgi:hypothetical protein
MSLKSYKTCKERYTASSNGSTNSKSENSAESKEEDNWAWQENVWVMDMG